jgi:hypothetical protein
VQLLRISVYSSRELQGLVARLREVPRETQAQIRRATKAVAQPIWQQATLEHVSTRLEQRVLAKTARAAVSNQNVTLQAAGSVKRLSGGLVPAVNYHAVEFGVPNRDEVRPYEARSKHGRSFTVKRRTRRQLRDRNRQGYVAYPAAADVIPRLASLWVQTAVRTLHEAVGD